MNEFERRLRGLTNRLTQWLGTGGKTTRSRRAERSADLRREASARAQQAAAKMQDFRQSERGQKAESTLRDLRTSDTAKRAEAKIRDLRASETGQKAESALSDLRQREPVKKAEESARKVMNDLFSSRSES